MTAQQLYNGLLLNDTLVLTPNNPLLGPVSQVLAEVLGERVTLTNPKMVAQASDSVLVVNGGMKIGTRANMSPYAFSETSLRIEIGYGGKPQSLTLLGRSAASLPIYQLITDLPASMNSFLLESYFYYGVPVSETWCLITSGGKIQRPEKTSLTWWPQALDAGCYFLYALKLDAPKAFAWHPTLGMDLAKAGSGNPTLLMRKNVLVPSRDHTVGNAPLAANQPVKYATAEMWWSLHQPIRLGMLNATKEIGLRYTALLGNVGMRIPAITQLLMPVGNLGVPLAAYLPQIPIRNTGELPQDITRANLYFQRPLDPPMPMAGGFGELANFLFSVKPTPPTATSADDPQYALDYVGVRVEGVEGGSWDCTVDAEFVMTDGNGRLFQWDVLPGFLSFSNARMFLTMPFRDALRGAKNPPSDESILYRGTVLFGDHATLQFDADYIPGEQIHGALRNPGHASLKSMLENFLGENPGLPNFPLTLGKAEFWVNGLDTTTPSRCFMLALDGHWDFTGKGTLVLEEVGFWVSQTKQAQGWKTAAHEIFGSALLADVEISLSAQKSAQGWLLQGMGTPEQPLALKSLTTHLLKHWDAPFADDLPDIALDNLAIFYHTGHRDLGVQVTTTWTFPSFLPDWMRGRSADIMLDLQLRHNPRTKQRETSVNVQWETKLGDFVLQAQACFEPGFKLFSAAWAAVGKETFGLAQLAKLTKLNFPLAQEVANWPIFNYQQLALEVSSVEGEKSLQLQALTRLTPDVTLEVQAALGGGNTLIQATWQAEDKKTLTLQTILDMVAHGAVDLSFFGKDVFALNELLLRYANSPEKSMLVLAESAHTCFKEVMLGWQGGVFVAAAFQPGTDLSGIPLLGDALKLVHLDGFVKPKFILLSNITKGVIMPVSFQLDELTPPTHPFGTAGANFPMRASQAVGVALDFTVDNEIIKAIHHYTGLTEIDAQILHVEKTFTIAASIPGSAQLSIPTGQASLVLHDACFTFTLGEPLAAGLRARCDLHFWSMMASCDVAVEVTTTGSLTGTFHATGWPRLPSPPALPGVQFCDQNGNTDYELTLGITDDPPGMVFGMKSPVRIGSSSTLPYHGDIDFMLDIEGAVPNPIYLSADLAKLDLWAMFEAQFGIMEMIDKVEDAGKALPGEVHGLQGGCEWVKQQWGNLSGIAQLISLYDASFHFAETALVLPDGRAIMPGAGFKGFVDFFGEKAYGYLEFSSAPPSLKADFAMAPFNLLGILHVSGDGKAVLDSKGVEQIAAGGPVLHLNSGGPPFLHASLQVALFDFIHASVLADITATGYKFVLTGGIGDIANMRLASSLQIKDGFCFQASGSFSLHLNADFGPIIPHLDFTRIHLDAGLDAEISLKITDKDFSISVSGGFEFEGIGLHMPELTITAKFSSFKDLPKQILDHIENEAEEIFSDIFDFAKKAWEATEKEVKEIAEAAVHEAQVIGETVEAGAKAAVNAVEDAAKATAHAAEAVAHTAEAVAQATEEAVKQVGASIAAVAQDAEKFVADMGAKAETALKDGVKALADSVVAIADGVKAVEHEIGVLEQEAVHELGEIAKTLKKDLQAIADDVAAFAKRIGDLAQKAYTAVADAAKHAWDTVKDWEKKFEHLVYEGGKWVKHEATVIINKIGDTLSRGWHTFTGWFN